MKTFSYYFMAILVGVILGYSWSFYHTTIVCLNIQPSEYDLKIRSYVAPDYFKHKTRNYNLITKFRG